MQARGNSRTLSLVLLLLLLLKMRVLQQKQFLLFLINDFTLVQSFFAFFSRSLVCTYTE
jgi:hypothetical protein